MHDRFTTHLITQRTAHCGLILFLSFSPCTANANSNGLPLNNSKTTLVPFRWHSHLHLIVLQWSSHKHPVRGLERKKKHVCADGFSLSSAVCIVSATGSCFYLSILRPVQLFPERGHWFRNKVQSVQPIFPPFLSGFVFFFCFYF